MNENQNDYVDINAHDNYPDSEQKIEVPTMKVIPLKKICMTIGELPTSYLETMTYYEMLIWFINYLRDNIIPTVNNNAAAVQEVQNVVMQLQNYINNYKDSIDSDVEELEEYMNNYFENLDVQEEINNKLDQMLEDGVLTEIIQQFLQSTAIWCFDTVADMQNATNLIDGSFARTLGYFSVNDGGGATYKITDTESQTDYQEEISNNLYATLIDGNNKNILKYGGVYGTVDNEQKTKNTNILRYLLDTYNGINLDTFETIEVINFTYDLKSNTYINNINLICYGTNYYVFGVNGERADRIKIGKVSLSKETNASYIFGFKLGDYLTSKFAPYLVIDDLVVSGFRYGILIFSWNSSLNRIQSYNCEYAGVLFGTSTNINTFYGNNCRNGVLMGVMIDENDNVINNTRTYFVYSNINEINMDASSSQSYILGIGNVQYVNINVVGYESVYLQNLFYGYFPQVAHLTIESVYSSGNLINKIYDKPSSKTSRDVIIINNIRGEYLQNVNDWNNDCVLIINNQDLYLGKLKGSYITDNIMIPYENKQRSLVNFSDVYKNGGGSTANLTSYNTYNKVIGVLNNNEILNIKLRGSRTSSASSTLPNRQIICLAKLIIGDADQYNATKINGETVINIAKDVYVQGGTLTPELSNTISNLTISVDTSEDLPILQIIPPAPTNANYSYNYAYMLEIIGGAYTEIYKTTRS